MKKQSKIETTKLFRNATIDYVRAEDESQEEEKRTFEISFSSEEPYKRYFGNEILDHSDQKSMKMDFINSGNAPLLYQHDTDRVIGVVEKAWIEDKKGKAQIRFSKNQLAKQVLEDVKDGILKNVSFGYSVEKMEQLDEESFLVKRFTPLEISIVSIPADKSVGFRSHDESIKFETIIESEEPEQTKQEIKIEQAKETMENQINQEEVLKAERKRSQEILALGTRHNLRELAEKSIERGDSIELFKGLVLEKIGESKPLETPAGDIGLTKQEKKDYSLVRAINAVLSGNWDKAGFEKSVSDEVAKRSGKSPRGFFVPTDLQWEQRDLTVGTTTAGGYLKETENRGLIDALRAKLVIRGLGAQVLSGLVGSIAIPTLATKTVSYWVNENTAPTEGAPVFGQKTASPKTNAAFVDMSRRLLQQSDPSVEGLIRNDLVRQLANALDDAAIEGGATFGPTGILNTSGIGSVALGTNGAAPTWASVVNLVKEVEVDNALTGNLAFLASPAAKAKLMQTAKVSSTDSVMIMNEYDSLLGYPLVSTSNCPSDLTKGSGSSLSALIFGNFNDIVLCEWSTIDIMLDPYTLSSQGATRMTAFYDVDVIVRNDPSFAAIKDMITT